MRRFLLLVSLCLAAGCDSSPAFLPSPGVGHRLGSSLGSVDVSWIPPLASVTGNSATVVVFDTTNGSRARGNAERLIVSCYFDQAVTILSQIKHIGSSTWRTTNGNGSGDAVSASTQTFYDYLVQGYDQRIEIVTGGTGPTTSEVDVGVVFSRDLAL